MTETFDCPKCGGPLKFEPDPGQEFIECPYCHETVIIPEDLRIPLPRVVHHSEPPAPPSKGTNWACIGIFGIVAIAVIVALILGYISDQPTADVPTDTPSLDASSETSTPISVADSATATVEAKATLDALQPMLTQEQGWPARFTDAFTDNSHKWTTGDVRDGYITGNRSISAGIYRWNVTTVQSASVFSTPDMLDLKDFYASVDMKLISMPDDPNADAGMVFRDSSTDQSWYYFSVNDKGQYYLGWYDGTDWYTLIPETDSDAIHIGQTNRLAVGVQGSQFIFLINGQMVDHFIDDNLKTGSIGVGVNLPETNEKAIVEFANFSVLAAAVNP